MKIFAKYLTAFFAVLVWHAFYTVLYAQDQMHTTPLVAQADTNSLLDAFKRGKIEGHFRYFFMATHNEGSLSDYYANAVGGGIKYETGLYRGFQLGISGFFIYNIGSSDLSKPDEQTGQMNRYEIGLFDITDPHNKHDIDRLEELYLKYRWKQSQITAGAQLISTPFINQQDGRMRPTEVAGVYMHFSELKNTKIEGGVISAFSPRSTVKWYSVAQSIGVYPQGVNANGDRNNYGGNTSSRGILLLDVLHKPVSGLAIKGSDLFVENVMNTFLVQADYQRKLSPSSGINWVAGFQGLAQTKLGNGGNEDVAKSYYGQQKQAYSFGFRTGLSSQKWNASINFNRITQHGQYLMPREWGRDPFFTFIPRERSEGFGDITAWVLRGGYHFSKARLKTELALGTLNLPEPDNFRLNKYGLPSYHHLLVNVDYALKGWMKGADIQLLYAYKLQKGKAPESEKYVINKVNMGNLNLVINYRF